MPKDDLQLLGVVALWVASKVEEILPPPISDFVAATDLGCTAGQMIEMERKLIAALQWQLVPPTAYTWASLYLHCLLTDMRNAATTAPSAGRGQQMLWTQPSLVPHGQINRVMELFDLAVLDVDSLCFTPSQLAATAIGLLIQRDRQNSSYTIEDLERVTQMSWDVDLAHCAAWMSFTLRLPSCINDSSRRAAPAPGVEPHTVQRHNGKAMDQYDSEITERGGAVDRHMRHVACGAHLNRTRRTRDSISAETDSPELVHQQRGRVIVARDLDDRAFSPVTVLLSDQFSGLATGGGGNRGSRAGGPAKGAQ
jgi:hypothetical protein